MEVALAFQPEAAVLDQGFLMRPAWWTTRLPVESWGTFLTALPAHERGYHRITRSDLLQAADCSEPDTLPRALVAAYAWGTGSAAFLVGRRARAFRTPPDRIADALTEVSEILRTRGPVDAYESMVRGGPNSLPFLGPSFFTKVLYALDSRNGQPGNALILDQFVAVALNDLHGWDLRRTGPWSTTVYSRWLDHAHRVVGVSQRAGSPTRADAVEMAYFEHGKAASKT